MPLRAFHTAVIEARKYQAVFSPSGLYLVDDTHRGVALGPAFIGVSPNDEAIPSLRGRLCICKYDTWQPHIDVSMHSAQGVQDLQLHFGLAFPDRDGQFRFAWASERLPFYSSQAFESLVRWCASHPRAAKAEVNRYDSAAYLGDWFKVATAHAARSAFNGVSSTPGR